MDTRFLRPAAIAILPLLLPALWNTCTASSLQIRVPAVFLLATFTLIPSLYGVAALGHKTFIRSQYAERLTDSNGLRHDLLSRNGDAAAFFEQLNKQTTSDDVIYLLEPTMGIPLKERRLFIEEHAHLRTKETLASRTHQGKPAGTLYIPLPKRLVEDGRAEAIKNSFRDITDWSKSTIENQPDWILLLGQ